MEIPDRIKQVLDGESIQSAVSLGDEDVICFTPTRTILYRGEGLLSDESVETFDHDVERLNVSEGRRKTTFALEYVDEVKKFKVTSKRTEQVLSRLLAGILDVAGVLDDDESVAGVYRFSELTLIITDSRLVKHVGAYAWDPDFEEYPYSEVTGLDFEEGSVATQIVISVAGRPQRIKAPNDEAGKLEQTLTQAVCAYHEVDSLDALNEKIGQRPDPETESSATAGLGLDENISPLVSDGDTEAESPSEASGPEPQQEQTETKTERITGESTAAGDETATGAENAGTESERRESEGESDTQPVTAAEFEELQAQVSKLTAAVETQQELLDEQSEQIESQRETIEQLIEELRRQT